jgi:hypothetical protein
MRDAPTCRRKTDPAVITTARMAATDVPAVLPESPPQGGLARRGQRMGTDANDPVTTVRTNLPGLVEEIDTMPRPAISSVAVAQTPRALQQLGQLGQRQVEPPNSRTI